MKSKIEFTVSGFFSDPRMSDPFDSAPELWAINWTFGSDIARIDGSMCTNLDSVDMSIPRDFSTDEICATLEAILLDYVKDFNLIPC